MCQVVGSRPGTRSSGIELETPTCPPQHGTARQVYLWCGLLVDILSSCELFRCWGRNAAWHWILTETCAWKWKTRGPSIIYLFFLLMNGGETKQSFSNRPCASPFVTLSWLSKWPLSACESFYFYCVIFCKIPESHFHHSRCPESTQCDPFSYQESLNQEWQEALSTLVVASSLLLWTLFEPHCFPSSAVMLFRDQLSLLFWIYTVHYIL